MYFSYRIRVRQKPVPVYLHLKSEYVSLAQFVEVILNFEFIQRSMFEQCKTLTNFSKSRNLKYSHIEIWEQPLNEAYLAIKIQLIASRYK